MSVHHYGGVIFPLQVSALEVTDNSIEQNLWTGVRFSFYLTADTGFQYPFLDSSLTMR